MVFLFTSYFFYNKFTWANFLSTLLLRYSGLKFSVLDAGLSNMGSWGLFLKDPL